MAKRRAERGGTPATAELDRLGVPYAVERVEVDDAGPEVGLRVAAALGVPPGRVFKTLLVTDGAQQFVGVVPVAGTLNLRELARALGVKSVALAPLDVAERRTGYVRGGMSPLGQRTRHRTVIDASARAGAEMYVSGGRRGLELRLAPEALATALGASFAPIASPSLRADAGS